MNDLKVQKSKTQRVLFVLLALFFVPMGLFIAVDGVQRGRYAFVGLGLFCLVLIGVISWLIRRAEGRSVDQFTARGLRRGDGRDLAWTDLEGVVHQIRVNRTHNTRGLWRTEIRFAGGEAAWILPLKVANYAEVAAYVAALPCPHTEVHV